MPEMITKVGQPKIHCETFKFPNITAAYNAIMHSVHSIESEIVVPGKGTEVFFYPQGSKLFDLSIRDVLLKHGGKVINTEYEEE